MDWATLRTEFPVTERWAFLDHAAVSPLPRRTAQSLIQHASDMNANGSTAVSGWVERTEETRRSLAKLLNCDPFDIALLKNTSEGLGIVAEGFPWRNGDNIVLPAEEYPSNQYPWMNLTHRGVTVRKVVSRGSRIAIDDLRDAINQQTRMVALSSVEYSSGFRNDLDAIGQLCRDCGAALCVDAIQSLGVMPLNLQTTPIDFLASGGHKWLLGPQGTGFLYVRQSWLDRMRVAMVGWSSVTAGHDYSRIDLTLKPNARRFESGTLNYGGLAALGESVRLLLDIGQPAVQNRIRELTDHLCEQVKRIGWTVFSSRSGDEWSGIVILEKPGVDYRALAAKAKAASVIVAVRGGRLRASPHVYNTVDELNRLVEILR
jgi:cysteine desulfurase / selenocysteine lyase